LFAAFFPRHKALVRFDFEIELIANDFEVDPRGINFQLNKEAFDRK